MGKEYKGLMVYKNGTIKKDGKNVGWVYQHGYVGISVDGKQETAHSIIMKVYVGPRPSGYDINHKNGNKQDNRLQNLEYITRKENIKHSFKNKLQVIPKGKDNHMYGKLNHWSSKPVKQYTLDGKFIKNYPSIAEVGRQLGMKNPSNIISVINGKRKHSFGFLWKYKNK